jgi:hypothetical protein
VTSVLGKLSRLAAVGIAVVVAMAGTIYAFANGRAATTAQTGTPEAYARLVSAPPVSASLALSVPLRSTAVLAGVRPDTLHEVLAAPGSLASIVAGRDGDGRTCVADVSPDIAGTFVCDPFRIVPIYLLAEAGGGAGRPVRAGFAGAADIVVRRLEVELADGSRRAVEMNAAGGFEYRTTDRAAFPVRLFAYGAGDRILLRTPLPAAAPPRTP